MAFSCGHGYAHRWACHVMMMMMISPHITSYFIAINHNANDNLTHMSDCYSQHVMTSSQQGNQRLSLTARHLKGPHLVGQIGWGVSVSDSFQKNSMPRGSVRVSSIG